MSGFSAVLDDTWWQDRLNNAMKADYTPAMKDIRENLEQKVRATFKNETDPWGNAWPQWANTPEDAGEDFEHPIMKARARRGNYSAAILYDTGALEQSITGEHDATSATITMGQDDVTKAYASVHQFGEVSGNGFTMPQRASMPLRSPEETDLPAEWYEACVAPLNKMFNEYFK